MGGPFTWSGDLNDQIKSRLDFFLVFEEWENHFNGTMQCVIPRTMSDHFLILLDGTGMKRGPFAF